MLSEETIRDAFENPSIEAPTVLTADEVGYDVDEVERNRGTYRVVLEQNITQDAAVELLEDAFGDDVFAVRTGTDQAVDDDTEMRQTVSFRHRD